MQREPVRGAADRDADLARFHDPGPGPAGERGAVGVQPERDPAFLPGFQRHPGEAGQPALRPDDLGHRVAVMAAVLLSVLPLVVLFVVMRKQVMRSLGSVVMR